RSHHGYRNHVNVDRKHKPARRHAGNKVFYFEVDTLFLRHPDVAEALATGAHDTLLGGAIHLLIVPRPHRVPEDLWDT
ncbi:MAG: hypothetical protein Q4P24_01555, partial [Rhodobacterales bacterium]|nr:hypothetical protein [Rhodobacterales bacterium]